MMDKCRDRVPHSEHNDRPADPVVELLQLMGRRPIGAIKAGTDNGPRTRMTRPEAISVRIH